MSCCRLEWASYPSFRYCPLCGRKFGDDTPLPCPRCGAKPRHVREGKNHWVACHECRTRGPAKASPTIARDAWDFLCLADHEPGFPMNPTGLLESNS